LRSVDLRLVVSRKQNRRSVTFWQRQWTAGVNFGQN
jgi:hypothetical protein